MYMHAQTKRGTRGNPPLACALAAFLFRPPALCPTNPIHMQPQTPLTSCCVDVHISNNNNTFVPFYPYPRLTMHFLVIVNHNMQR